MKHFSRECLYQRVLILIMAKKGYHECLGLLCPRNKGLVCLINICHMGSFA